jgi:hypothetical protein
MCVAIEGREILGHCRKCLNRHGVPPRYSDGTTQISLQISKQKVFVVPAKSH